MKTLFVDTNIVIDLLTQRANFYQSAQGLFTLADNKKIKLQVSALTFANVHYLLRKHFDTSQSKQILLKFKILVEVLALDDKIISLALASDFGDYEEGLQYFSALENGSEIIITRNKKDFKNSLLPVLTAEEYLNT